MVPNGSRFLSQNQELYSQAYLDAIAAQSGCNVNWRHGARDRGLDGTIEFQGELGYRGMRCDGAQFDFQLKSLRVTSRVQKDVPGWKNRGQIPYDLELDTYDRLRSVRVSVPRILVLVLIPDDPTDWIRTNQYDMSLHHRAFWTHLGGDPASTNATQQRVFLPIQNALDANGLMDLILWAAFARATSLSARSRGTRSHGRTC